MAVTYRNPSGHLRPWKSGPKQYKTGPGLTGRARLARSARALLSQTYRFSKKADTTPEDAAWAREVVIVLQALLAE